MRNRFLPTIFLILFITSYTAAQSGYAMQFDGIDDYISVPHNSTFNISKVTIEMWMNWQDAGAGDVVQFLVGKYYNQLEIHTEGGSGDHGLRFIPTPYVFIDTDPGAFSSNTWNHIAFVYDPSISLYKCYINGVEKSVHLGTSSSAANTAMNTTTTNFNIGRRQDNSGFFKGKIDEIRIWNYARSGTEIVNNMNTELSGTESGLVAYYKMSNGSGTTLSDNGKNGNNGTLMNGTEWIGAEVVLPVELASFNAKAENNRVDLSWMTHTETNNYGFEIQRLSSAADNWEKIGFVRGSGSSNKSCSYNFIDKLPVSGTVQYRLKQIDNDGNSKLYDAITVEMNITGRYTLEQNTPNPFNPSTAIIFRLPASTFVNIKIYDQLGREVTELINQEKQAGSHVIYWNGRDGNGQLVSSGVYLYKLTAGTYTETRKMNLLK